jgi:hypothetical protein
MTLIYKKLLYEIKIKIIKFINFNCLQLRSFYSKDHHNNHWGKMPRKLRLKVKGPRYIINSRFLIHLNKSRSWDGTTHMILCHYFRSNHPGKWQYKLHQ